MNAFFYLPFQKGLDEPIKFGNLGTESAVWILSVSHLLGTRWWRGFLNC